MIISGKTTHATAFERFQAKFADALQAYAHRLGESETELMIAISRKGPRLLQLIGEMSEVPSPDMSRCISEKALPFIPRGSLADTDVCVTDDTIAYGSTFARNCKVLQEARASVRGEVLAMSKGASPRARQLLAHEPLVVPEAQIHQLIDLEIQAFGALAVPYDIDHPIFTVPFDGDMEDLAGLLEHRYPGARRPTNSWHEAHRVTVLSLPTPEFILGSHSQASRRLGPLKLRLFLDAERHAVRAVAIFALALREAELRDPDLFNDAPAGLAEVWRKLLAHVERGGWPTKDRCLALANTAHYLAGCEALALWLAGDDLGIDGSRGRLSELDLRFLFGLEAAAEVRPDLQAILAGASSNPQPAASSLPLSRDDRFDVEDEIRELLSTERGKAFAEHAPEYLGMAADYDPGDLIHSFFNAQRRVYDEQTRNGDDLAAERLSAGLLPFPVVTPLLKQFGAEVSDSHFEHFADLAIDGGSVVPHYTAALSQEDLWLRSVRAGERGTQKLKHWLYRCAGEAERAYELTHDLPEEQRGMGVPWYVCEKLFAVLAATLEPELRLELGDNHVICGRDEFGARAVLPDIPRQPFLLDWGVSIKLLQREAGPIYRRGGAKARGDRVSRSPAFRKLYPERQDTVDRTVRQISRSVIDAFIAIDALFEGKQRDLAVLAISSCGSHDAYLRSLSAEVEVWLFHQHINTVSAAVSLEQLAENPADRDLSTKIGRDLGRSAVAIVQSRVKREAYESRMAVREAIDSLCEKGDPRVAPYFSAWEEYIRPLIDDSEVADDPAEAYLRHAAELARTSVSVARTVLSEHDLVSSPKDEDHTIARHVDSYKQVLAAGLESGLKYTQPAVAEDDLRSDDPATALRAAGVLLTETYAVVEQIWNTWRRPAPAGALQSFSENRAILLWDVIGSSQNGDGLQEAIHRVEQRISEEVDQRGAAPYSPNQDDGNAVVLPTARDAFEVFLIAAEIFAADGIAIRAGIETAADGQGLSINSQSGEFGGMAYSLAARARDAFSEISASKATFGEWEGSDVAADGPEVPEGSYVMATEKTLKQLREREDTPSAPGCRLYGVIRGYSPRVRNSLSTDVSCFVPDARGG